jgi:phage tail sheath gpL-like
MGSSILIPGLTQDDKVPGRYTSLSYGVGRRSVGNLPVYLYLFGAMREPNEAGSSIVTSVGGGPTVTVSGTPSVSAEYVVTISLGGANGTAEFGVTQNGTSLVTGVVVPTTPFTYVISGTGLTITFGNGTHILNATHSWTSTAAETFGTAQSHVLYDVYTEEAAEGLFDLGSELGRMASAALRVSGVTIRAMAVEWADGAAKATLTCAFGGTWETSGVAGLRLGGKTYRVTVNVGDSLATICSRMADAINADKRAFCTADADDSSLILTVKTAGVRGNFWNAWKVLTDAPSGLTMTLTGGSALTGGGVPFSGGSGADDVSDALEVVLAEQAPLYNFQAWAQNDAVNMAEVETQLDAKAGALVQEYEQATFVTNGTMAAAISLAQTTLNHVFSGLVLDEEGESHPAETAAVFAAIRAVTEGSNPNPNYNDRILPGIAPRAREAQALDVHSKRKACLNAGVTPTKTVDGKKLIVRAITTKCLTGSTPDYSTLDVGEATVPMRISREIGAEWYAFALANPYAGPDPDAEGGERAAPQGVATPSLWNASVYSLLKRAEKALWIHQVDLVEDDDSQPNLPTSEWDDEAERIMSSIPVVVRPLNSQLGTDVRQAA